MYDYKMKIDLIVKGVNITDKAGKYLQQNYGKYYNDDYVTTTGVMLEVLDLGFYVTAHVCKVSPFTIDFLDGNFVIASDKGIFKINIWPPSQYMSKRQSNEYGLLTKFVNSHFDRVRISPISGCANHCAFCSMNENLYRKNSIDELEKAFIEAIKDKRITHVLISGGSPRKEDLGYLTEVYKYFCEKYKNYKFDVMVSPRGFDCYDDASQYEEYLIYLKNIGVDGLSINLELFNETYLKKFCPEKYAIGQKNYLYFLKCAAKIFGTKNVRSGLIVGLEPLEDTLKAVEAICECKCMPMLSPYIPYNHLGEFPSTNLLIEAYEKTMIILKKHEIPLAPLCDKCRHNTL